MLLVGLVLVVTVAAAVVAVPRFTGSGAGVPLAVVGMVTFDAPVGGADVRIVDGRGRELATAATDESGAFEVDVARLPEAFRVVVSGGDVDGRLSPVELARRTVRTWGDLAHPPTARQEGNIERIQALPAKAWKRVRVDRAGRYRNRHLYDETIQLDQIAHPVRQIAIRNIGRDLPTLAITNDRDTTSSPQGL